MSKFIKSVSACSNKPIWNAEDIVFEYHDDNLPDSRQALPLNDKQRDKYEDKMKKLLKRARDIPDFPDKIETCMKQIKRNYSDEINIGDRIEYSLNMVNSQQPIPTTNQYNREKAVKKTITKKEQKSPQNI